MLKIELRHYQTRDDNGQPYRWTGNDPQTLQKLTGDPLGIVPENIYFDATKDVLNLEDLDIIWAIGNNDQHFEQTISEEIEFTGKSAKFIRSWIVNKAYSPLNIIECKFTDVTHGKVIGEFLIKPQKVSFCEGGGCDLAVTAVQNDLYFECISKTPIADNWNGFLNAGFRAYDYCVEKRPAVMTAVLFSLGAFMLIMGSAMLPLSIVINFLVRLVGGGTPLPTPQEYIQAFWQLVGFGRVHSAASIRDYTNNVCNKCGVQVDTANNFLFKEQIEHNGQTIQNPFFWLDILFATTEKGKKNNDPNRFKLNTLNIPLIGLSDLYNDLGKVFNAKWYITTGGKLRFMLRQEFAEIDPIFDFSNTEWYASKRLLKLCQDITGETQPLTVEYGYQNDTIDLCANDVLSRYNSYASFDIDGSINPNLKGHEDKKVPFGATQFRDDNFKKDYIDEATNSPTVFIGAFAVLLLGVCLLVASVGLTATLLGAIGGVPLGIIAGAVAVMALLYVGASVYLDLSFKDAIVMSQDVCSLPKLLIRANKTDGQQDDSRAENGGTGASKIPNPLFNPQLKSYDVIHDYNEEKPVQNLRNYPLFFDVKFKNNVFDICHSKDDFRVNAVTKREITAEIMACRTDLDNLGVYEGQDIALDQRFKFKQESEDGQTYAPDKARIKKIKVNFMSYKVELSGVNVN